MTWDETSIAQITRLWELGLSATEIGQEMGATKNSIIGKAHRLGLPSRPSPIALSAAPSKRRAKAERRAKLVPPASILNIVFAPAPVVSAPPVVLRTEVRPLAPCCWPLNDARPWRFCDAPCGLGRSYCAEHFRVAHTRTKSVWVPL